MPGYEALEHELEGTDVGVTVSPTRAEIRRKLGGSGSDAVDEHCNRSDCGLLSGRH